MREMYPTQAVIDIHMERGGAFDLVDGGIAVSGRYTVEPHLTPEQAASAILRLRRLVSENNW